MSPSNEEPPPTRWGHPQISLSLSSVLLILGVIGGAYAWTWDQFSAKITAIDTKVTEMTLRSAEHPHPTLVSKSDYQVYRSELRADLTDIKASIHKIEDSVQTIAIQTGIQFGRRAGTREPRSAGP